MHSAVLTFAALGLAPSALAANLIASHFSGTLYSLSYNRPSSGSGNGTLAITSTANGCGRMPAWLHHDSASKSLICVDESYGSGVVSSFSVADSGAVSLTGQSRTTGGDVHGSLYGGSDGKGFVALAEYDPSTISTYKLPLSSSSTLLQKEKFNMTSPGPVSSRQNAPHPHAIFPDPTGRFLLVPDLGADLIRIFSVDATSGRLTTCPAARTAAGDGPRHGTWWQPSSSSTQGLMLYTINELSNSVSAWKASYSTSGCMTLSKTQTLSTFASGSAPAPRGRTPIKAAEVHVVGNYLIASNRNDQLFGSQKDSLATYSIDGNGTIAFVEASNAQGWYPRTFSVNKAGDLVAVGGQTSANVAILSRNVSTGKIGGLLASVNVGNAGSDGGENGLSAVVWAE